MEFLEESGEATAAAEREECKEENRVRRRPYTVRQDQSHAGAHTGFFNERGTGPKVAMGPRVTPPQNPKTPRI